MRYVIIDGIDGTGKTTISRMLEKELGLKYVHFPTDKSWFKDIPKMNPSDIVMSFVEDFHRTADKIFKDSTDYVFDRSFVSSMLYQSEGLSEELGISIDEAMLEIAMLHLEGVGKLPELVVLLDADVDVALNRVLSRSDGKDPFEKKSFLEKIRSLYPSLINVLDTLGVPVMVIDTTNLTLNDVYSIVRTGVTRVLGLEFGNSEEQTTNSLSFMSSPIITVSAHLKDKIMEEKVS